MNKQWCVVIGSLLAGSAVAQLGITNRVSVADIPYPISGDTEGVSVSAGGNLVAFMTSAPNVIFSEGQNYRDIFVVNRATGIAQMGSLTHLGGAPNDHSDFPVLSGNGRYLAFQNASPHIAPPDANGAADIFMRDLLFGTTIRISVSSSNLIGNSSSTTPSVSFDGRYVAFASNASNLVAGDTNSSSDIFVRDIVTGVTERVSVATGGVEANGISQVPSISANGRFIAFASGATNLVAGDTNSAVDVFVHDRDTDTTIRVSLDSNGAQAIGTSYNPSISGDGEFAAFESVAANLVAGDTNGVRDVFVKDLTTGIVERISVSTQGVQSNASSGSPRISIDGAKVTFESFASTLVANDTNSASDVFVRDLNKDATTRVSISTDGAQGSLPSYKAAFSPDGGIVCFLSASPQFDVFANGTRIDAYAHDVQSGTTQRVSGNTETNHYAFSAAISGNGRFAAFTSSATNLVANDTNGVDDIFVHDRLLRTTTRVSVSSAGVQSDQHSNSPSLSYDGRYVAFWSNATTLVEGDTNGFSDYFLHDRLNGTTTLITVSTTGGLGNGHASIASNSSGPGTVELTPNGRYAAFHSMASNLVANDTNGHADVFVRDLVSGVTIRASVDYLGNELTSRAYGPSISGDGSRVAFVSDAPDIVQGVFNGDNQVFLRDLSTLTNEVISISSQSTLGIGDSFYPSISGDGNLVCFGSAANNLVSGDTGRQDVFVRDISAGITDRVSASWSGGQPNGNSVGGRISADGRFVAFESVATNITKTDVNGWKDVFIRNLSLGSTRIVSLKTDGDQAEWECFSPFVSADGLATAFSSGAQMVPEKVSGHWEAFVRDHAITPQNLQIVRGGLHAGNDKSLLFDDNDRLSLRPGVTFTTQQDPVEIVLESYSPQIEFVGLTFGFESSATSAAVRQSIELYDFDASEYVQVDIRQCSVSDTAVRVEITENVDRFKGPKLELRARLRYRAVGPVFVYPWRASLDRIFWVLANDG